MGRTCSDLIMNQAVVFSERPDSVPYSYRITYKLTEICLIIKKSTKRGGVSLAKINIISDCISSQNKFIYIKNVIKSGKSLFSINYDSTVIKALYYLSYEGLVCSPNTNYKFSLTEKGDRFIKKIIEDESLLKHEKEVIEEIGFDLNEILKVNY